MIGMMTLLAAQVAAVETPQNARQIVWDCVEVGMTEKQVQAACGDDKLIPMRVQRTGRIEYDNTGKTVSVVRLRTFFTNGATMIARLEEKYGAPTSMVAVNRDGLDAKGLGSKVHEGQLYTWRLPHMTIEYLQPGDGKSGEVRYSVIDRARDDIVL